MNPKIISKQLATEQLAQNIIYVQETDSTNNFAKQLACNGALHGTLVIADKQTAGRGRRGRSWISDNGTLCMSFVLRPAIAAEKLPRLPIAAAVAVAKAMQEFDIHAQIKWPNDILVNGKKLCGILFDGVFAGSMLECIICGIGINVHSVTSDTAIAQLATSIFAQTGKQPTKEAVAACVANMLEKYLFLCYEDSLAAIINEYHALSCVMGKYVEICEGEKRIRGVAQGLDDLGRIIIENENGKFVFDAGDVSLRC